MFGGRKPDGWWVRELERQARAHDAERARWDAERRELVDTICRLSHLYTPGAAAEYADPADETSDTWTALDDPDSIGGELHHLIETEG
jgi:hypothetical protein